MRIARQPTQQLHEPTCYLLYGIPRGRRIWRSTRRIQLLMGMLVPSCLRLRTRGLAKISESGLIHGQSHSVPSQGRDNRQSLIQGGGHTPGMNPDWHRLAGLKHR